jgi:SAM-dependent methyltransferase
MDSESIRASYEVVAEAYAEQFYGELYRKPFDQQLLDTFAAACAGKGSVLDIGCGPGHVTRYLKERGVDAAGMDLSQAMVNAARRLNPDIEFTAGDMRRLPAASGSLAAITAFYSIIHVGREEIPGVLAEFRRALAPQGRLLISLHGGTGAIERDQFLGHAVPFRATLVALGEIVSLVEGAGFWVDEARQREPYEFENPTPRIYVAAHAVG